MLKFNVAKQPETITIKDIKAKIVNNNEVQIDGKLYPIAAKSKSVNGHKTIYINGTIHMLSSPYNGECEAYRPFKVGITVLGKISSIGEFIISK